MDDVVRSLIDLSFSQKTGDAIGRYGVGRLTGAKYCDELIFETSALMKIGKVLSDLMLRKPERSLPLT